jgi:hypothetical protein
MNGDVTLVASTQLVLPEDDVDSDDVHEIVVDFYEGELGPVVALVFASALPRSVALATVAEIADDLHRERRWMAEHGSDWNLLDVAKDVRWVAVSILRGRVRAVEESVRRALSDEHVSTADYEALREYPVRLARVERLAATAPMPSYEDHRPRSPYALLSPPTVDHFRSGFDGVPNEARDAVARLSGLISSQQVVLTRRQAEETERFQRLVTLVGTAVLVPGLVAAVFGANVGFHGRDRLGAFWAMLLFMVAGGVASYALLRSLELRVWSRFAKRSGLANLSRVPDDARLLLLATFGALVFAAGLFVLSRA